MNADRRSHLLPALLAMALAAIAAVWVAVAALADLPSAGDWLAAVFESGSPRERLVFTLVQAAASTALGVALGLVASWFLARPGLPLRWLFTVVLLAPVAVPGVALAMGLRELAGEVYRAEVLIGWAHAAFAMGVTAWVVTRAWASSDRRLVEQSVLLGTPQTRARMAVARRAIAGSVALALALGFANAATALATVVVLGGPETWTVEALLFEEASVARTQAVSTLAGIQLLLGIVAYLWTWRWPARAGTARRVGGATQATGMVLLVVLSSLVVAPLAALAGASTFQGLWDAEVGGRSVPGLLRWSAVYAVTAAALATALAWLAAGYVAEPARAWWRSGWRWAPISLLTLPLLLSPVVAGLGVREAAAGLDVDLQRTWAPLVLAHALIAFPLALRVLTSTRLADAGRRYAEAAVLLGQSERSAAWRWRGRLTLRALAAALLVSGALVAGEAGAASLLSPGDSAPAAVALLQVGREGSAASGVAFALASVLAASTVVAFALGEWLRRRALGAAGAAVEAR